MKTLVIIPSRLSASRLPGKPLLKINGISIISHVFKKAEKRIIELIENMKFPEHKLDNAILNAALGVAKENENLKEKTEELDERVSELTKKIEIFLNQ